MNRKHAFFWGLLRPPVILFLKLRFGYKQKIAKNLPEQYLVLSNHVTDYDPLLVAASFPRQMYFVASEHIARWKVAYLFIKYLVEPIIRYKGAPATAAIVDVMKKMKKGANVCIFAEGVRSWDGRSCPIAPSTAKLVKSLGCGLVTYKITGGYFTSPMWSGGSVRRGELSGAPVGVYTKEDLAQMTKEEIYEIIVGDLYEDAYARQLEAPKPYRGKDLAKGLENLMFICPNCGKKDTFVSEGNKVTCQECGVTYSYTEYGMMENAPYDTLSEFVDWQKEQVRKDVASNEVYRAHRGSIKTVKNHVEIPIDQGEISLSPSTLRCGFFEVATEAINDLAMHGQRAIVFSVNKEYYEMIPEQGSNALKFFLYYQELKNKKNS